MKKLDELIRDNVRNLIPYSAAREKYQGAEYIFLDANENPFGKNLNRYPDPYQQVVKRKIASAKNIDPQWIFTGNGSDEIIDLLIRAFCNPGKDNMILPEPTYGMYEVAGNINDAVVRKCLLSKNFQPDPDKIMEYADEHSKLIFLCSPNNPTGNLYDAHKVIQILNRFQGVVVLDEAYIDFADKQGFLPRIGDFPNLVILQTFSKAKGLAGIRLGYAFAQPGIIEVLNKIKYPYNVSRLTQQKALKIMKNPANHKNKINRIKREKERLVAFLENCTFVDQVFPSDANFLLVKVREPKRLLEFLAERNVIIRDRSYLPLCERSVRITVGKPQENNSLIKYCRAFEKQNTW